MSINQKAVLLKNLYRLKALGFSYIQPMAIAPEHENTALPNNLAKIARIVAECHLCDLAKTRKHAVFGEGHPHAKLMFVGEGPGATEDEMGRPFVGRAGELLTKMIENVLDLKRSDVYITNIVKCRPPGNRVPEPNEADACLPYLMKQIELVAPRLIVTLGATAYEYLVGDKSPISKIRGEVIRIKNFYVVPTYHPSYLLRNPAAKKEVYRDLLKIKSLLCEIG